MAERRLIDGGVVNNTPISHAVELGAERIYVLPTQDPCCPLGRVPKGALDAAIYGLELLIDSRLKTDIAQYSRETEIIVLPAPNTARVQPTSFEHSSRLISEALVAARTVLESQGVGRHLRLAT
jgi:NTE family protein